MCTTYSILVFIPPKDNHLIKLRARIIAQLAIPSVLLLALGSFSLVDGPRKAELNETYNIKNESVKSFVDLSGLDFSHRNLNGFDFTGSILKNTDFSYSNLAGAIFTGADISKSNFSYAFLKSAIMNGCVARETNFEGAYLRSADLQNADLSGSIFNNSDLWKTNISYATVIDTRFINTDLTYVDFTMTDLTVALVR